MQLKRIALDTALNALGEEAEIAGVKTSVVFQSESQVVDGYGNQVISNTPRILFLDEAENFCVDDEVVYGGEKFVIFSIKKQGHGYGSAELGKTKN